MKITLNERNLNIVTVTPESVKQADMVEELKAKLETGIVQFAYLKADGSVRTAFGTKCGNHIPSAAEKAAEKMYVALSGIVEHGVNDTTLDILVELYGSINKPRKESVASETNIIYYDLEAKAFRSFVIDKLLFLI